MYYMSINISPKCIVEIDYNISHNIDALKETKDLVRLKEHRLKDLQPNVKSEEDYTLENCKKARDYAVKKVKQEETKRNYLV